MGRLIPVAKCQVENELRHSLSNKKLAIVFDGASVDGDLVAVLFRYVDDWTLKKVLVRTKHADCTVNNKQYVDFPSLFYVMIRLNGILSDTLRDFGIPTDKVLSATCDSVSVNIKAMESMSMMFSTYFVIYLHASYLFEFVDLFGMLFAYFTSSWGEYWGRSRYGRNSAKEIC
jgi:hypothetical protein